MNLLHPVWEGYLADPFILRHETPQGLEFYAYGTGSNTGKECTEEGCAFPVLRSQDLEHWEYVGGALTPSARYRGEAHWAPEVAYRNGRYWLYYSSDSSARVENHHIRVAVADHPAGPFEDVTERLLPKESFTIDPHPFQDPATGAWYMYFAKDFFDQHPGTALAVAPLQDSMQATGPVQTVLRASAEWQIFERNRTIYERVWDAWYTLEGPSVVFRQGRYYLFYSGGRWENESYGVAWAVAEHPLGPWQDFGTVEGPTVLRTGDFGLIGPGHCSVLAGPDSRDYMVFHAWNESHTKRQMHLTPLYWTAAGPALQTPQLQ